MPYPSKNLCAYRKQTKMSFARINTGKRGEDLALRYLKKQGYRIIERNFKTRQGEIDIIACDNDCISFVEVRSRSADNLGLPEDSIDRRKQKQIAKVALAYIKRRRLEDRNCKFDVICVEDANSVSPKVRLIKNAFELDPWYRY